MEPIQFFVQYKVLFVIAHVLSVVIGMGGAIITDFLCVRYCMDKKLSKFEISTIKFLSHIITAALLSVVMFGFLVFLSNPSGYLASSKFLLKMTVVGVLVFNGVLLHRLVFPNIGRRSVITAQRARPFRQFALTLGAISVVSWVSALILGMLSTLPVSYVTSLTIYFSVIVAAVIAALSIEFLLRRVL